MAKPFFQLPFPCGEKWRLDTWGHAPALDMVRAPVQTGTEGSPIVAPADGVVNQAFYHSNAGNTIQINHGGGWFTTYIHLQSRSVQVGQKVNQGDMIGRVGRDRTDLEQSSAPSFRAGVRHQWGRASIVGWTRYGAGASCV